MAGVGLNMCQVTGVISVLYGYWEAVMAFGLFVVWLWLCLQVFDGGQSLRRWLVQQDVQVEDEGMESIDEADKCAA